LTLACNSIISPVPALVELIVVTTPWHRSTLHQTTPHFHVTSTNHAIGCCSWISASATGLRSRTCHPSRPRSRISPNSARVPSFAFEPAPGKLRNQPPSLRRVSAATFDRQRHELKS
jgi:hypothetical protein